MEVRDLPLGLEGGEHGRAQRIREFEHRVHLEPDAVTHDDHGSACALDQLQRGAECSRRWRDARVAYPPDG